MTAIDSREVESPPSEPILFETTPVNKADTVEPLPISDVIASPPPAGHKPSSRGAERRGDLSTSGQFASSPATTSWRGSRNDGQRGMAAPLPKAPVELHATVITPDLIRLSWRPVGPGYVYNAYSSGTRDLASLHKENEKPLNGTVVEWIPETGLERYWVVVTAIDPQGRESAYSEPIEVIRHPEKTKSGGALDQATDMLKRVVPWPR